MQRVYPDYYPEFKCIADKCRHNCCIGWEIDIDKTTYDFYKSQGGSFSRRFKDSICHSETPYFILDEKERCPFLNSNNLCDIIAEFSEEHLCDICREHPRFHNDLGNRTESGLGLTCEECARIIILKQEPVKLINNISPTSDTCLRDRIILSLQDRALSLEERFSNALKLINSKSADVPLLSLAKLLCSLERLDHQWGKVLVFFTENYTGGENTKFRALMKERLTEYEQLAVYLIYRHFVAAEDDFMKKQVVKFSELMCRFLCSVAQVIFEKTGEFTTENQLELIRLFSSEVEYSDENLEIILESI